MRQDEAGRGARESACMPILKRGTGDAAGQIIELKNDLTLIRRSPQCHIVLDPNSVSRRHQAIHDIARTLSIELKIDNVAPKILDSLVELFPQAERLFLMLIDPATKRLVRKAFKYRPGRRTPFGGAVPEDEIPMSISRSLVNH